MNKRQMTSLLSALLMLFSGTICYGQSFSDIRPSDWYAKPIQASVDKGIIKGYADGTFKPEGTISKAEFVTLLVRALGHTPEDKGQGYHWSSGAFAKAREINALKDGELNRDIDGPIQRYDMALLIANDLADMVNHML